MLALYNQPNNQININPVFDTEYAKSNLSIIFSKILDSETYGISQLEIDNLLNTLSNEPDLKLEQILINVFDAKTKHMASNIESDLESGHLDLPTFLEKYQELNNSTMTLKKALGHYEYLLESETKSSNSYPLIFTLKSIGIFTNIINRTYSVDFDGTGLYEELSIFEIFTRLLSDSVELDNLLKLFKIYQHAMKLHNLKSKMFPLKISTQFTFQDKQSANQILDILLDNINDIIFDITTTTDPDRVSLMISDLRDILIMGTYIGSPTHYFSGYAKYLETRLIDSKSNPEMELEFLKLFINPKLHPVDYGKLALTIADSIDSRKHAGVYKKINVEIKSSKYASLDKSTISLGKCNFLVTRSSPGEVIKQIILPPEISVYTEIFSKYYKSQYEHSRSITYDPYKSTGTITFNTTKITLSLVHMSIIILLKDSRSMKLSELASKLNIEQEELIKLIEPLKTHSLITQTNDNTLALTTKKLKPSTIELIQ